MRGALNITRLFSPSIKSVAGSCWFVLIPPPAPAWRPRIPLVSPERTAEAERHFPNVIAFLLTNQAEVNARTSQNFTPVHVANSQGFVNVAEVFRELARDKSAERSWRARDPLIRIVPD